jgi:hypothetical protein
MFKLPRHVALYLSIAGGLIVLAAGLALARPVAAGIPSPQESQTLGYAPPPVACGPQVDHGGYCPSPRPSHSRKPKPSGPASASPSGSPSASTPQSPTAPASDGGQGSGLPVTGRRLLPYGAVGLLLLGAGGGLLLVGARRKRQGGERRG